MKNPSIHLLQFVLASLGIGLAAHDAYAGGLQWRAEKIIPSDNHWNYSPVQMNAQGDVLFSVNDGYGGFSVWRSGTLDHVEPTGGYRYTPTGMSANGKVVGIVEDYSSSQPRSLFVWDQATGFRYIESQSEPSFASCKVA